MINYTYTYLVGGLILLSVWIFFFLYRKDLRREIWFGSFLALPFGFVERLIVPVYWNPPSVFDLIHKFGFGIESFLFAFTCGGIASAIFEVIGNKKLIKNKKIKYRRFIPFYGLIIVFILLEIINHSRPTINLYVALLVAATLVIIVRKELIKHSVLSGLFFLIFYFILFRFILFIYPGYINAVYNLTNLSGVFIFGIPVEELIFSFCLGAAWSIFYDYIRNLKDIKRA